MPVRRLTVWNKVRICIGAILVLTSALSIVSVTMVGGLGRKLETAINQNVKAESILGQTKISLRELRHLSTDTQYAYVLGNLVALKQGKAKLGELSPDCSGCHLMGTAGDRRQSFGRVAQGALAGLRQLQMLAWSDASRQAVREIGDGVTAWQGLYGDYLERVGRGEFGEAHAIVTGKMTPLLERLDNHLAALTRETESLISQARESSAVSVIRARNTSLVLMSITLGCAGMVLLVFRQIAANLRVACKQLHGRARRVSELAENVHSHGVSLSDGAEQQVQSIESTASSSQEVSATAAKNAADSSQVADVLASVRLQMDAMNRSAGQTVTAMCGIDESSRKISKIIQVINEIAFQTNLLALNAAVEAARAGQAGTGFAVVANEVRTLAQRSADAARDTEQLIQESIGRTRHGKTCLDDLLESIQTITGATDRVTELVGSVRVESGEQALAVRGIGDALARIEQVTRQTAANAEESTEVATELREASTSLDDVVEKLHSMMTSG